MGSKITIAIDGYSSCGKSTLAKQLANALGYIYIDSGAMYRAVTLYAINHDIIQDGKVNEDKLLKALDHIDVSFEYDPETKQSVTLLNGKNVEREIREMPVSENVSKVAIIKEVRAKMVEIQRKHGENKGVVMDGRDIGSVVFPNAELKIFMTADPEIRAERRFKELKEKGIDINFDQVRENLKKRDFDDTTREENPLIQADDAVVIDNSDLSPRQQFELAYQYAQESLAEKNRIL